jgi:hypothetical protein
VASAASNASAALVNLVQTARDRISTSSKGLVSVFTNPPTEDEYTSDVSHHHEEHYFEHHEQQTPLANENTDELDKTVEDQVEEGQVEEETKVDKTVAKQNEPDENI